MQTALTPEDCYQALSSMRIKPRYKSRYSTFFLKINYKRLTSRAMKPSIVRGKSNFGQFSWAKTESTATIPVDLCHAAW